MVAYFLDTYALIEIVNGNKTFAKYTETESSTSILNLYELYYNLLKISSPEEAKRHFFQLRPMTMPFTNETIFKAAAWRYLHKKKKFSYADALGYFIALENGMVFVTGDGAFEHFENVEFMK